LRIIESELCYETYLACSCVFASQVL
jgi:hypothetical protein